MSIACTMKMKKRQTGTNDKWILHQILQVLLFYHHSRLLPLLCAICSCLILLSASLSFLSPPISPQHHPALTAMSNNRVQVSMEVNKGNMSRLPMAGRSSSHELWTSNRYNIFTGAAMPATTLRACSYSHELHIAAAEMNTETDRYLLVATSGGLNQQRTGITDAVVAAYILNATLVVPKLDQESFWEDSSNFSEIFDVDWFITYLSKDVKIIRQLPEKAGKVSTTRVPRKCDPNCYRARLLPVFEKKHVQAVQLMKFDYRLSNWLDEDLQKLRCRVNYHALRFAHPILEMGRRLVERMKMKSMHFVALHLRYEADMLAFSGCYYGGGEKEKKELGVLRKRWKNLQAKDAERERRQGKCPLSPEETGLMLRALGFGKEVHLYVASGEIYGAEEAVAPLRALFPNLHTKETLATKEELAEFSSHSSRMAALDFIVCDQSEVLATNNNGNMAKMLSGRRRYFGHKPTIRPNAKKLEALFLEQRNMTWEMFSSSVRKFQIGFMGEPDDEVKPGRGSFHESPWSCICTNSEPAPSTRTTINDITTRGGN